MKICLEKFMEKIKLYYRRRNQQSIRAAVMDMAIIPMIAGSSFKNKGVQFMLDAVCKYCLLHWIKTVEEVHPDDADLLEEDQTKLCVKRC
jgi:elongation factor G